MEHESEQALKVAEAKGFKAEQALAHRWLAYAARARGRLNVAMKHNEVSIEIWRELSNEVELANDYGNLGIVSFGAGYWLKAEMSYLKALEKHERIGSKFGIAQAHCNLGDLYCHRGDLEQGFEHAPAPSYVVPERTRGKRLGQWLRPQLAEHLIRVGGEPEAPKLAHIVKVERALVGQVPRCPQVLGPAQWLQEQAPTHAQVNETDSARGTPSRWIRELKNDVFGPSGDARDTEPALAGTKASDVLLWLSDRARPVHLNIKDLLATQARTEFTNDGLNFGQFGHRTLG